MLKWENLDSQIRLLSGSLFNEPVDGATLFELLWTQRYATDKFPNEVLAMRDTGVKTRKSICQAECLKNQA